MGPTASAKTSCKPIFLGSSSTRTSVRIWNRFSLRGVSCNPSSARSCSPNRASSNVKMKLSTSISSANVTSNLVPVSAWYTRWPPPRRSRPSLSPNGPVPSRSIWGIPGISMSISLNPSAAIAMPKIRRIVIDKRMLRERIGYSDPLLWFSGESCSARYLSALPAISRACSLVSISPAARASSTRSNTAPISGPGCKL